MGFVLDTHTHTIASAHAYSTVAEMAKAAGDRGLGLLAVTDHGPALARLSRRSNVHKNKKAGAPPKGSSGLFVYEGNTG